LKAISVFLGIAFGLSIILSLFIGLTGGHASPYIGFGIFSMVIPALSVILVQLTMNEGPKVDWSIFPLKYLPVAILLIPVVMHAVMLPVTADLEGGLHWQSWLSPGTDGVYYTPPEKGWGMLTWNGLIIRVFINIVAGLVLVSFMAFFEEIGWRGWLLPRFEETMGSRAAVIAVSAIWALWHVPYALSGIMYVEDMSPLQTAMIVPAGTLMSGLVIGWLWLRTRSIWIVAIAHGALNNLGQYAFKYMDDFAVADPAIVLIAGGTGLFLTGSILLWLGLPNLKTRR
jgi:membrane protease YdiL (CAAX protease family)